MSVALCSAFLVLLANGQPTSAVPPSVAIGGLFAPHQLEQLLVFYAAIEKIQFHFNGTRFTPLERFVNRGNSFVANAKTCELLEKFPVALFGPIDEISCIQVQSICEHLEIPHLDAQLMLDTNHRADLNLNLYPDMSVLSDVLMSLLDEWRWGTFAIVYDDSESIVHFRHFFRQANRKNYDIRLYELQPDRPYRDILWKIKKTQITNVLLDVRTEHIEEVLKQALQVGILTERHNYLFTSLVGDSTHLSPVMLIVLIAKDLHTLDLTDYRHSRANITSLKIVNEDHPWLTSLLSDWEEYNTRYIKPLKRSVPRPVHLKSQSAMIYDAIQILAQGMADLKDFKLPSGNCNGGRPWKWGTSLVNFTRRQQIFGITGFIQFGNTGFRSNLKFDILSVTETNFEVIATWRQGKGIRQTSKWKKHSSSAELRPPIRVTTVLNDPFVMNAKDTKALKDNDRYEGYVIDLMTEISNHLGFRFEINLVKDRQYGSMINATTNEWNGMIGEVLRGEADIAVADLTINSNRELAVDFTQPFMKTGISILYKKPITKETSFWSFLSPFSPTVWLYLLTAFASISFVLFYIGRFTPYEWANPQPCPHHDQVLQNACSVRNSFWSTIGSLMQQGSDVTPRALSTRIISASWYFFTLIIVSSYTANLAAFLTVENVRFPFETADQLAEQNKIKYGCLANGSTHKFFTYSNIDTYRKIGQFMNTNPQFLQSSNAMGRVVVEEEDGKYAFFMESATIEYITERYCNLTQVGGLLDHKGYGVAIKKGSKFRSRLSETILKLQETGVLQRLKDRWWKQKGGGQCTAKPPPELIKLNLQNLGGVFVVLVAGTLFAIALGICEFMLKARVIAASNQKGYKSQLMEELAFAFSCWRPTKVVKRKSLKSLGKPKETGNQVASFGLSDAYHAIEKDQALAMKNLKFNRRESRIF